MALTLCSWVCGGRCDCRVRKYRPSPRNGRIWSREAALNGSREVSFTIVSMTLSLVAVFIPDHVYERINRSAISMNLPSPLALQF